MAQTTKNMQVQAGNANANVTAVVSDSMPGVPCPGPTGYRYKGLRYVPKFADPVEWSSANSYEAMTIVMNQGNSYTSKQAVPVGVDIANNSYWVKTFDFNAQLELYRNEVAGLDKKVSDEIILPEDYGCVGDGLTDDTIALQAAFNAAAVKGALRMPKGKTYLYTGKLVLPLGAKIIGETYRDENYVTLKKGTAEALIETGGYCLIESVTFSGNNQNGRIIDVGARTCIQGCCFKNFETGVQCSTSSSNFSVFRDCTFVYGSGTAVNWVNSNQLNGQACLFEDVDIRNCLNGMYIDQPGNAFVNVGVQNGLPGGYAVKLGANGNNNAFYGTYFENANFTEEVIFDSASSYNIFTGERPSSASTSYKNANATNFIMTKFMQNTNGMGILGTVLFNNIGVNVGKDKTNPSAMFTIESNSKGKVSLKSTGTSSSCVISMDNTLFDDTFSKVYFNRPQAWIRSVQVDLQPGASMVQSIGYMPSSSSLVWVVSTDTVGIDAYVSVNDTNTVVTLKNNTTEHVTKSVKLSMIGAYNA